ncbi:MAG TPA: stress response translation initiation inhibitor YciH [bacterium]|jgi:translation initiation factor 1|nr:stress response translation initiation inhibitor YciH [bacterium]
MVDKKEKVLFGTEDLGVWDSIVKEQQTITVRTERRRFGKDVTIIEGFTGDIDIKSIASKLKASLACGGTAKNNYIELQGNHKDKVVPLLVELGFNKEQIYVD